MPNNADRLDLLLATYAAALQLPLPAPDVAKAGFALALEDEDGAILAKAIAGILKTYYPIELAERAAPAALANTIRVFCTTNNLLAYIDEGGVLRPVRTKAPILETIADTSTITPNCDLNEGGNVAELSQGTILANPTGTPLDGQEYTLRVKTTTTRTWGTYGTQYRGGTVALQTATTGSGKTDYHTFRYNAAATKWDLVRLSLNF